MDRRDRRLTPAMKQYWDIKQKYPDCIVLFRMGDFYETFYDDAKSVSKDLQIVLTARGKGDARAPLAGIPYHALNTYLKKLIDKGRKVVIAEQLEDPKKAKGLIKRGVARIVTPGTLLEPFLMNEKSNNYAISLYRDGGKVGLCACDISVGEIMLTEIDMAEVETEFEKYRPSEVIAAEGQEWPASLKSGYVFKETRLDGYKFDEENGLYLLKKLLGVSSYSSYGIEDKVLAKKAFSGLLSYLDYAMAGNALPHIRRISFYNTSKYMVIDAATMRNLDLIVNQVDGSERGTLLNIINRTITPMGNRLIRRWICTPLLDIEAINGRLDSVENLVRNPLKIEEIRSVIQGIGDIERIATRVSCRHVLPRELLMLNQSLEKASELKGVIRDLSLKTDFYSEFMAIDQLADVRRLIKQSISESAKQSVGDGSTIKKGFNTELDEIRDVAADSKEWLVKFEEREREKTGIKTLKVRYNKIIGYFIEVPKAQQHKVPSDYVRKQTQIASERFISMKLKEKELLVLNAEEKIREVERRVYSEVVEKLCRSAERLYEVGKKIAELDVYQSFAKASYENGYTKPLVHNNFNLQINEGRHPVVEKNIPAFVPNSVAFDEDTKIMVISGPNMAGKSTVMRQVALTAILAQAGCYVPAGSAVLPIVDRVFTRVGARDDIMRGQSTFMMEMVESANILNNATERSLIILDEIGRGTSTYDGMAIAWSIIEYIAENIECKTMFATHYHLLNLLSLKYGFIKNYNIMIEEDKGRVAFLHKLVPGGADKSYGIHVAGLAGLPAEVIEKAKLIAKNLEENDFIHKETLSRLTRGRKGVKEDAQTSIDTWTV